MVKNLEKSEKPSEICKKTRKTKPLWTGFTGLTKILRFFSFHQCQSALIRVYDSYFVSREALRPCSGQAKKRISFFELALANQAIAFGGASPTLLFALNRVHPR